MIIGHGLIGLRDPNGIRPLVLGQRETPKGAEWMLASESVALDMLGFKLVRDVAPGEVVYIDIARAPALAGVRRRPRAMRPASSSTCTSRVPTR